MKKRDMIECLINYYCDGNKAKFATKLGMKPQSISMWLTRDSFDAELIFKTCEGISASWLLTNGEGEMLSANINNNSQEYNLLRDENIKLRAENNVLREVIGSQKKDEK